MMAFRHNADLFRTTIQRMVISNCAAVSTTLHKYIFSSRLTYPYRSMSVRYKEVSKSYNKTAHLGSFIRQLWELPQ